MSLTVIQGPNAVSVTDYSKGIELTIDWSYDGLYFRYDRNQPPIVLSIGPETKRHELNKINTPSMINDFKVLSFHALNNLRDTSDISDNALVQVQKIVDLFV